MKDEINFLRIFYASLLYSVCVILIGYFVPELEPYAAIIAAIGAGVYAGYGSKMKAGAYNGLIAGIIGGLITGFIAMNIEKIAGIPISISFANFLQPIISTISLPTPLLSLAMLIVIGFFFGMIGGFFGSIKYMKPIFLFSVMFFMFILLGAVDNAAWNIQTPNWTWSDSFSHVFHNRTDIIVALVFAFIITILTYVLNLFKKDE